MNNQRKKSKGKLIIGIILAAFGLLGLIGAAGEENALPVVVLGALFIMVGIILILVSQGVSFQGLFNSKQIEQLQKQLDAANAELSAANEKLQDKSYIEYKDKAETRERLNAEIADSNATIASHNDTIATLREQICDLRKQTERADQKLRTAQNKVVKYAELNRSMNYAMDHFFDYKISFDGCKLPDSKIVDIDTLSPSVTLHLHSMDIKDLRKAFRQNERQIEEVLSMYESRYTGKTVQSLYRLMVISLRAELQNILIELKYEKLDTAIEKIKATTAKYLTIATEGNQTIAGTMTKFIGQIEYLFINSAKIEYNYYVKKEQARQEQAAIREQMRLEAQERKALEEEKKKIEKEESKFNDEITKLREKYEAALEEERAAITLRITELEAQLSDVTLKKDEIVKLQNGKAGNIYIISNLGSFGDDVFKVGMTRRLDPQDRVNELGSASVPFKFDVHSFIFSDDAVDLETKLHTILNEKRVNKVNRRKEFFRIPIDELEQLVQEIDPTAEFTKTMAAEEYRQSLSSDEVYTDDFVFDVEEDEDE